MNTAEKTYIPFDRLQNMIGEKIHISWAHLGCVWILEEIIGNKIKCRTPKTNKILITHSRFAVALRKDEDRFTKGG